MFQDLLAQLHSLVSGLDPWQQLLALVPVGAIPFLESYLGSFLGTALGIHPALVIPAAVLGNLLATFGAIALSGRARDAVADGRRRRRGGTEGEAKPSRFRAKVASAFGKYGVPGVCLLGPFVVAHGAARRSVYLWMAVSIVAWGVAFCVFGRLFLAALV